MTGRGSTARRLGGALPWLVALLLALTFGMASLQPLFHAWFPQLQRPLYTRASFPGAAARPCSARLRGEPDFPCWSACRPESW
jgi:hypothetical protein